MRSGIRIGIDVGTVRVGVSMSDPEGILATPVRTLQRQWQPDAPESAATSPTPDDIDAIADLVSESEALEVVVGLPRSLSGSEGVSAAAVRTYAAELARRIAPVKVRLVDERLTSVDAHRVLRDSGVPGRTQRRVVDQAAAVLILQGALDQERHSARPPGELLARRRPKRPAKDGER